MPDYREDQEPFYVMDVHGKILTLQSGQPEFCDVQDVRQNNAVLFDKKRSFFVHDNSDYVVHIGYREVSVVKSAVPQRGLLIEGGCFFSIGRNNEYLSSDPSGSFFTTFRKELWEKFFLLPQEMLQYIQCIMRHGLTLNGHAADKISINRFNMKIDAEIYCLEKNRDISLNMNENFLIRENMAIDRAAHYNPAIYYCAFEKRDVIASAVVCAKSIVQNSGVDFSILIFTNIDNPSDGLDTEFVSKHIKFVKCDVFGYSDIFFFRYSFFVLEKLSKYNLVFYSDSDVICNGPLLGMVNNTISSEKICVNLEHHVQDASVGGWFISDFVRRDEKIAHKNILPVNSGFFGFSSFDSFENVARFMKKIKENLNKFHYKNSFGYDQSVFNYAITALDLIDDSAISSYIVNWPPEGFSDIRMAGLVHFCGGLGEFTNRRAKMEAYVQYVDKCRDDERKQKDLEWPTSVDVAMEIAAVTIDACDEAEQDPALPDTTQKELSIFRL